MKITEIFADTGKVIEREATADELAQMKINEAEAKAEEAKAKIAADAKVALLTKLGINAEEANLLLS